MTITTAIDPGFADPVFDCQACFRGLLNSMSQPGLICSLGNTVKDSVLHPATLAIGLTLFDFETRLWLDAECRQAASNYFAFHCNCSHDNDCKQADFAIITQPEQMPALDAFQLGSHEYPDRSTTLIIQSEGIDKTAPQVYLKGAGIQDETPLAIHGIPASLWQQLISSREWFPRGVDVVFTYQKQLVAIPRTTHIRFATF